MSRFLTATALALLLCACATNQPVPQKPEPVPEQCSVQCRTACTTDDIRYPCKAGEPGAFDCLVEHVVSPLRDRVAQCDRINRGACVQCLDRLKAAGVTR